MRHIKGIVRLAVLVAAASIMAAGGPAAAATRTWTGSVNNEWFMDGNWTPLGTPHYTDHLYIYSGSPFAVTDVTADSGGSITFDGPTASGTFDYALFPVGSFGAGALTIRNGGQVANTNGDIGYYAGSAGTVTVDNGTWTNSGDLSVGLSGSGALTISNAGLVENTSGYIGYHEAGTTSTVTVDGVDSTWTNTGHLYVGYYGRGELSISNGGLVGNTDGYIAPYAGSTGAKTDGAVTVDNGTWTNSGDLFVGMFGAGLLSISNGGAVDNTIGYIGEETGSRGFVTVDGVDSSWTNSGALYVGSQGGGELSIRHWAQVESANGTIGAGPSSTGTVTVDNGTWTNSGHLSVGVWGTGELNIRNGGHVATRPAYIGFNPGSTGTVTVDNGTWTNNSGLCLGGSHNAAGGTGILTVANGGEVNVADTLKVWGPGTVNLLGGTLAADTIDHTQGGAFNFTSGTLHVGTFQGNLTNAGGTLAPGSSPGTTVVTGDYTQQAGGALEIEIVGAAPGQWDVLDVTGTANLDGALEVVLDGYTPAAGDSFAVMTYGSRSGEFAETTGWLFDGNKALVKVYGANALTLVATYRGDATLDFCVDGLDYIAWSNNYLTGDTWREGDYNDDGYVDGLDYITWSNNYKQGCPGMPGAVPEPSSALLIALCVLSLRRRPRG